MPLTYVGAASAAGTSVAIPAHQVGDIVVVWAYRDGSTATPTKPAASGTVPAWVDINNPTGANTNSARSAYFVATSTTTTTGTWTNATGIAVVVLRGQAKDPIGGATQSGGTAANSAIAPATTLRNTTGSSVILEFHGHRTVTAWGSAPTGYTRRTTVNTELCVNTKNSSTTDGQVTQTNTATSSGYRGETIEILSTGQQWYCDNAIGSSGDGKAWASAWKNFSNIDWTKIGKGDFLNISGGSTTKTYSELLAPNASNTNQHGTATDPITIRRGQDSGHNGQPIIDGGNTRANCLDIGGYVSWLWNYITISGIKFQDATENPVWIRDCTGVTVEDCEAVCPDNALYSQAIFANRNQDFTVRDCTITSVASTVGQADGIYLSENTGTTLIEGNSITISNTDTTGHSDCIQCYLNGATIIRNNVLTNPESGTDNHVLWLSEHTNATTTYVYNNVLISRGDQINVGLFRSGAGTAHGQVNVYNNTIHGGGYAVYLGRYTNVEFKNNIIQPRNTSADYAFWVENGDPATSAVTHNLVHLPGSAKCARNSAGTDRTYSQWTTTDGYNANGVNADPLFVNPTSNLSLQPSSPAINAGTTLASVTTDILGVSRPLQGVYDIGAYEVAAATTYSKTGGGAAAGAASGPRTVTTPTIHAKTGGAASAAAASGAKTVQPPTAYTKAGGAGSALAASGPRQRLLGVRTGGAAAAGSGTGAKSVQIPATHAKTGGGAGEAAASGVKSVQAPATHTKTGGGAGAAAGSGSRARALGDRQGGAAGVAAGSGAKDVASPTAHDKTGGAVASAAASGGQAVQSPTIHQKTGGASAEAAGSGLRNLTFQRTGSAATEAAATGEQGLAVPATHAKTGGAVATAAASGASALQPPTAHEKTGGGAGAAAGSGVSELTQPATFSKTGGATTAAAGSGTQTVDAAGAIEKTGGGATSAAASGVAAVTSPTLHDKAGGGAAAAAGGGSRGLTTQRTGGAAGDGAGSGTRDLTSPAVHTKAGGAVGTAAGSGVGVVQAPAVHPKTGGGAGAVAASGAAALLEPTRHDKTGGAAGVAVADGTKVVIPPTPGIIIEKTGGGACSVSAGGLKVVIFAAWPPRATSFSVGQPSASFTVSQAHQT